MGKSKRRQRKVRRAQAGIGRASDGFSRASRGSSSLPLLSLTLSFLLPLPGRVGLSHSPAPPTSHCHTSQEDAPMRRGFSQVDCANYLKQCTTTREVLEVLTAYAYLCAFPAPESDRVSQCDVHLTFPLAATEQQVRSGCLHRHGFAKTTSPDLLLACHVRSFASPLARGVPLTDATRAQQPRRHRFHSQRSLCPNRLPGEYSPSILSATLRH